MFVQYVVCRAYNSAAERHLVGICRRIGLGSAASSCRNLAQVRVFELKFAERTSRKYTSVILRWQFIVNVADERDSHLCGVVSSQDVADKVRLNLHLDHLQCSPEDPAKYIGVP